MIGDFRRGTTIVAWTTLREAIYNRLLLTALLFGVVLVGLSVAAASVSIGERARLILDVGLAAASALGSAITIALGVTSFAGEITRRTAYPWLARPVPRASFVLGKLAGVTSTMWLVVGLMILSTMALVTAYGKPPPAAFWASAWLTLWEMLVVAATAVFFSTFASPPLASLYSAAVVLAGNLTSDVLGFAERLPHSKAYAAPILRIAHLVLPDLSKLSARTQAANALPVTWDFLTAGTLYAIAYAATLTLLAAWIFHRRRAV